MYLHIHQEIVPTNKPGKMRHIRKLEVWDAAGKYVSVYIGKKQSDTLVKEGLATISKL